MIPKIKRLRLNVGLTGLELARRAGINNAALSGIERRRLAASASTRAALSEFFRKDETALFDTKTGLAR